MEHSPPVTVDLMFAEVHGDVLAVDVIIVSSTLCGTDGVATPGHPLTLRLRSPAAGSDEMHQLLRWTASDGLVGVSSDVDVAGNTIVLLSQHESCVALEFAR